MDFFKGLVEKQITYIEKKKKPNNTIVSRQSSKQKELSGRKVYL